MKRIDHLAVGLLQGVVRPISTARNRIGIATALAVLASVVSVGRASTISGTSSQLAVGDKEYNYDSDGYLFFGIFPAGTTSGAGSSNIRSSYTNADNVYDTSNNSISTNGGPAIALPSYVTSVAPAASPSLTKVAYGFSYSNISPTNSGDVESGVAYLAGTTGNSYDLLNINLASTVPGTPITIGVLVNNEANTNNQYPTSLTLRSSSASNGSVTVQHSGSGFSQGENDLYLFNVTPTDSDVLTLSGVQNSNMFNQLVIVGLTFSSAPEPGSLGVMLVGGVALLARRRRGAKLP
jgi:hypothetical protein